MPGKNPFPTKKLLMCVIADESTVTGFLLTGMGERDRDGKANYFICGKDTPEEDLNDAFDEYLKNPNVCIIFIA